MRNFNPLFFFQLRILRERYGTILATFFLVFKGGEVSLRDLEKWNEILTKMYSTQKTAIRWLVISGLLYLLGYIVMLYLVPAIINSQTFKTLLEKIYLLF